MRRGLFALGVAVVKRGQTLFYYHSLTTLGTREVAVSDQVLQVVHLTRDHWGGKENGLKKASTLFYHPYHPKR